MEPSGRFCPISCFSSSSCFYLTGFFFLFLNYSWFFQKFAFKTCKNLARMSGVSKVVRSLKNCSCSQEYSAIHNYYYFWKIKKIKNTSNPTLHYVFQYLRWPLINRTCLFEWLAALGWVFEVMSLILQLVLFFGFWLVPYKHISFRCLGLP